MGNCIQAGCAKQIFGECVFYTGLGVPLYDISYGDTFNTVVQKITDFVSGGGGTVWGTITGTLSNQTDLQTALNGKFNNPLGGINQYLRGDGSVALFPTIPAQVNILAGTGITVSGSYPNITISDTPGGDDTTASNIGSGSGIFAAKVIEDLQFKSLVAGTNISLLSSSNEIQISTSGVLTPALADISYFKNGGNTFASPAILGTNDIQPLSFQTNGIIRATYSSTGHLTILQTLTVNGNCTFLGTSTIIGSGADTGEKLQVYGEVKVGTRANAAGNFATYSPLGVLQERTPTQTRTDIGAVDVAGARAAISVLDTNTLDLSYNSGTGVISGKVKRTVSTVTTSVPVAVSNTVYLADTTSGAFTITIDPATLFDGTDSGIIYVKKLVNSTNHVSIAPSSGLIEGGASYVLQTQNEFVSVISNGTNLYII